MYIGLSVVAGRPVSEEDKGTAEVTSVMMKQMDNNNNNIRLTWYR